MAKEDKRPNSSEIGTCWFVWIASSGQFWPQKQYRSDDGTIIGGYPVGYNSKNGASMIAFEKELPTAEEVFSLDQLAFMYPHP